MAFKLKAGKPLQAQLRKVVGQQIDRAIAEIDDPGLSRPAAVHQVRRRCKKIRSVLRLFRPVLGRTYAAENRCFRDIGRRLAGLRDAKVMASLCESSQEELAAEEGAGGMRLVLQEIGQPSARVSSDPRTHARELKAVRATLRIARKRVRRWKLSADGFEALACGLQKTYRRGRKAMKAAITQPSAGKFHKWRKRVKYHRHHLRLLRDLWPPVMNALRDEAARLSSLLGEEHDLSVLRDRLLSAERKRDGDHRSRAGLLKHIDQRRGKLRSEAMDIGRRIHAEKPKHLARRLRRYWDAVAMSGKSAPPASLRGI